MRVQHSAAGGTDDADRYGWLAAKRGVLLMPTCAFVSFRLGLTDGVSVVAAHWIDAFRRLGFDVVTVAGEGPVTHCLPGLAIGASDHGTDAPALAGELRAALDGADLVVVENLLTIPMNLPASRAVAAVLRNRPALLHHHDPPWQRARYRHVTELPVDDPAWRHVVINRLTAREMADRGIEASVVYNGFDVHPPPGKRAAMRRSLDVSGDELLFVHPVRAIARKNVPAALAACEAAGATYWLTGPAEEDYSPELDRLLARARCRVVHQPAADVNDLYAAADAVLFPSTWEGFGNPPLEASIRGRPVAVGDYPVARELRELGFAWHDPADATGLAEVARRPEHAVLARNREIAMRCFSFDAMQQAIADVLDRAGWLP